jgi:hypothetical protein
MGSEPPYSNRLAWRALMWCVSGLLLAYLLAGCDASAVLNSPAIALSTGSGGPGTAVTVVGGGFPADSPVSVRLGPPDVGASPQSYGDAITDAQGRFVLTFTMPDCWPNGAPIAEHGVVVIVLNADGSAKATAPFAYQPAVKIQAASIASDPALPISRAVSGGGETLIGQPVDSGSMAFFIPEVSATAVVPSEYILARSGEAHRRGSFVSYDFIPGAGETPRFAEIQFFSAESIRAFAVPCAATICFEGDYPTPERYEGEKAALSQHVDYGPFRLAAFGDREWLVTNHPCAGDSCAIREYTTFLGDTKVDVWVLMQDDAQADASDALFASFRLQGP